MNTGIKKKILIVDDHACLRDALTLLINSEPDLEVCASADSLGSTLRAVNLNKPDIVLLDINLNGVNGIEVLKNVRSYSPKTPVLMFSMHNEQLYAIRALRSGAAGYIMKSECPDQLMHALREVLRGEIYLSPAMEQQLAKHCFGRNKEASTVDALSDRELEILSLIGNGYRTRGIAEKLRLSIKTVESHRANIKAKLNLKTAGELINFATEFESLECSGQRISEDEQIGESGN